MKKYGSYKDSGVEWIGEIPEHWGQQKLKYLAKVQPSNVDKKSYDHEQPTLLCNYVDVYKNEFIVADMNFMEATATPDEIEKFRVDEGDVLVTKDSESADDIAVPAYVKDKLEGVTCGYHLTQIKPDRENLLGGYLFRLFQTPRYNNQFRVFANGVTRYGLSIYYFENALIPLPSIDEQNAIANFLDDKTSQIDSLIQKKQQMIALLEEEKTAVINEAVTKGLNPDAPMNDSGIEWLGMVPAHWEVKKLKYISPKIGVGLVINPSTYFEDDGTIPMLTGRNVLPGKIIPASAKKISEQSNELLSNTKIYENDIVTVRVGFPGTSAVVPSELDGSNCASMVIIRRGNFNSHYISSCLNSRIGKVQTEQVEYGAAQRQFNLSHVIEFIFPFPPLYEQDEIVNYLDVEFSKIDKTISRIKEEIELMQEYRTALISEAVTGKIDVRDYHPEPITSTALA